MRVNSVCGSFRQTPIEGNSNLDFALVSWVVGSVAGSVTIGHSVSEH